MAQRHSFLPRHYYSMLHAVAFVAALVLAVSAGVGLAADAPGSGPAEQIAVFSGGCFWGVDGVFEHVKGVSKVVSGYAGGTVPNPSYEMVSTGTTGYAESVE